MLVGLGALALGAAIGWHLRLEQRRVRAAGAMPTAAAAPEGQAIKAPKIAGYFNVPIGGTGGGCGCS